MAEPTTFPSCIAAMAAVEENGVPVFRPTFEEFRDFAAYVAAIEAVGGHRIGLARVVPPPEWQARRSKAMANVDDFVLPHPIEQQVDGRGGVFIQVRAARRAGPAADSPADL